MFQATYENLQVILIRKLGANLALKNENTKWPYN